MPFFFRTTLGVIILCAAVGLSSCGALFHTVAHKRPTETALLKAPNAAERNAAESNATQTNAAEMALVEGAER